MAFNRFPTKVTAILNAPKPINVQQLRSFLGLVNYYYRKFIPNLATLLHPLNALLRADRKWKWSPECDKAFQDAKDQLTSAKVLTHYNPTLPIVTAADASAYGMGAVISHVFPDNSEQPIAFASRTLTTSEKNYAQLEKEALALVFGVRKFHQYPQQHRHPPERLMVVTTCRTFYLDRGGNVVSAISLLEPLVLVVNILCKVMCYLFSLLFLY